MAYSADIGYYLGQHNLRQQGTAANKNTVNFCSPQSKKTNHSTTLVCALKDIPMKHLRIKIEIFTPPQ